LPATTLAVAVGLDVHAGAGVAGDDVALAAALPPMVLAVAAEADAVAVGGGVAGEGRGRSVALDGVRVAMDVEAQVKPVTEKPLTLELLPFSSKPVTRVLRRRGGRSARPA
jgi:hypothetical protein